MVESGMVQNTYERYDGFQTHGADGFSKKRTRYEDKVGVGTPGWPTAIRTNSYLRSKFTWEQSELSVNGTVNNGFNANGTPSIDHFFGNWADSFGLNWSPWDDDGYNLDTELEIVQSRLMGKLIDDIQSRRVNLGEIYHTRAQAASMVASTANRLAGSFLALRRGNFAGAARYLTGADPRTRLRIRTSGSGHATSGAGGIPEQWLALQYGWKPALQDVYNSLETVRRANNDNGDLFSAKATASASADDLKLTRSRAAPHGPDMSVDVTERQVRGNASVTYGIDSSFMSNLSQLGIINPASLAWELLPYSFVVDWFIPIGSFLERLDYTNGLVFRSGWWSYHAKQKVRQRVKTSQVTSGNITASWSGGSGQGEAFVMARSAISDFPSVPTPRFKDPFSLTHVANALSLLATAFRGGKIPR